GETSILPALIFNTKKVLPPGKFFFFWPSKMELHFLQPVVVTKLDDFETVKQKLHEIMTGYYVSRIKQLSK
ncbi:MAG: lysophospholipid acyltransferase family protein, partial [Ginsengibacter sp.]